MAGKENREIKNSVFVDLFYEDESAEANEIALFNAIHDEPLPKGTKIRKFRVDNTIYMNFQNDMQYRRENTFKLTVFKLAAFKLAFVKSLPLKKKIFSLF